MPNPVVPDESGAAWMNDVERRLRALETAPRLTNASVQNGSVTFYDGSTPPKVVARIGLQPDGTIGFWIYDPATGNPVLKLGGQTGGLYALWALDAALNAVLKVGKQADGAFRLASLDAAGHELVSVGALPDLANTGLQVRTTTPRDVLKITATTQASPRMPIPMGFSGAATFAGTSFRPGTTAAGYTELWRGDFTSVGGTIVYDMTVWPNGNTQDWRIMIYEVGGTPQVGATITGETVNQQRANSFSIPASCLISGTDPVGRSMTLRVETRKTAGAGQVDVTHNAHPSNSA